MTTRSLVGLCTMVVRPPMDFEGSHGVHPVGHVLMTRLSRRRLGVTNARGIIGFGRVLMTSRRSAGSTLGGTLSYVVASWTGMI